jgi:decaprenylphospho-beta-D-erythro-pentofuranosid-2-ulose 2-reductase
VVVFGGSSDIARAITKKLCMARTHTVILAGRNQTSSTRRRVRPRSTAPRRPTPSSLTPRIPLDAAHTVEEAFAKAGDQVDLVVVAVGTVGTQSDDEVSAEGSARMITVNETWPVAALAEVRRRLVDQGSGRILVLSSTAAIRVRRVSYLYSGAKAGLDRICVALAESLEGTGCDCSCCARPRCARECRSISRPLPFTTGVNEVADNAVRGLARKDVVIWSPPVLRYVLSWCASCHPRSGDDSPIAKTR